MDAIEWNEKYPSKKILRKEIMYMLEAFVQALFAAIPESEISGIYFKGSAKKEWDSPLDYMPEISDVDIHLLLTNDSLVEKYFGTTEQAIDIQSNVEKIYFSKVANPIHVPRPQLLILNPLLKDEDFVPSPANTISVLYGLDYPKPGDAVLERLQQIDRNHLIDEETFLAKYPLHVIDRPSKYLWQALRNLVWHISPIGSRILSIKGKSYDEAWGINRTKIVSILEQVGKIELVCDYTQFYLNAWDYFLSDYTDTDMGRKAILSGVRALRRAVEIAKAHVDNTELRSLS